MKQDEINIISFKRIILFTVFFIMLSFSLIISWARLAPLESASIAPGFVRAEGQNKKVEHIFGGKVDSINISNGDFVTKGEVLITLDNREIKTSLNARINEYLIALAQRDVANSLLNSDEILLFDKDTVELARASNNSDVLFAQKANFDLTRQVRKENEQILLSKNKQIEMEIQSQKIKTASLIKQFELSETQLASYNKLVNKKHIARLQVIELEKEINSLKGKVGSGKSLIEEKKLLLEENILKIENMLTEEQQKAAIILAEVEESIPEMRSVIARLKLNLNDSEIRSPVNGKVTDLKVSSIGETIKSGEELMKILPVNDVLIIEARLNTSDIESINEGQKARVRLTAYNFRNTPMLDATVASISADRMQDELGYYYQLKLLIDKSVLEKYPHITLAAGMPAEGIIINEKRTVLDYLLEPIKRGINRSLRES